LTDAWQQRISAFLRPGSILVGIGNRLRGDDAFGPMLIDRMREYHDMPWRVFDAEETPENLSGAIAALEPESVLLLDACRSVGAPGDVSLFPMEAIPYGGISTHAPSLRLFAEFLSWRVSCPVAILGVEPCVLSMGAPLSPAVERSLDTVAGVLERLASNPTSARVQA